MVFFTTSEWCLTYVGKQVIHACRIRNLRNKKEVDASFCLSILLLPQAGTDFFVKTEINGSTIHIFLRRQLYMSYTVQNMFLYCTVFKDFSTCKW